jgi:hypothetical protein
MPSTSESLGMREWMTTQRNLTILTAILVGVPTAYGFRWVFDEPGLSGSFLLLMTLGVGVPTAYDEYWSKYDRARTAVAWTVTACVVATVEFTGFYLLGVELLDLAPLFASVGAFLVTELGNLSWLAVRNRQADPDESA